MAKLVNVSGDFENDRRSRYFMGVFHLYKPGCKNTFRYCATTDVRAIGAPGGFWLAIGAVGGAIRGASQGVQALGLWGAVVGGISGAVGGAARAKLARELERGARDGRDRFLVVFRDGSRLEGEMDAAVLARLKCRFDQSAANAKRRAPEPASRPCWAMRIRLPRSARSIEPRFTTEPAPRFTTEPHVQGGRGWGYWRA